MTAKHLLDQIERGLDGVTDGPWLEDGRHVFIDTREQVCCGRGVEVGCPEGGSMLECCGNPDFEGDYFAIAEGIVNNIPHIARCSPDTMREIIAYVRETEARATAAEATVTALQEALSKCRTSICGYTLHGGYDQAEEVVGAFYKELMRIDGIARTALTTIRRNDP